MTKNQMDESSVTEDYSDATLDDVLSYMADQWGYSAEDAEKDWNDYYAKDYTDENGNVNYGEIHSDLFHSQSGHIRKYCV